MRWVLPPDGFFLEANVPKLQHVPILIDERGDYLVEANRYLVERSCGEWAPHADEHQDVRVLTSRSRGNCAARLCAFLRWCDQQHRDWRYLDYEEDILGSYQTGLLEGKANTKGRPLAPDTINIYVDEACSFLKWAVERGYRDKFQVSTRRVRTRASQGNHSYSHLQKTISQRLGKLRASTASLDSLPSVDEVATWYVSVARSSPVKALIFELICRTGARISEANELRVSCFPRKSTWKSAWISRGEIPITLRYGVKGGKVHPNSTLSTRQRVVHIPIDLAERIEHYIVFVRPHLLACHHRDEKSNGVRTDRLWLGERKRQPISNQMLYKAWVQSPVCPEGWHPHAGRAFFAVEKICEATKLQIQFHDLQKVDGPSFGWLYGLMAGQVRLILSPLMGHASESTTMIYLQSAHQRLIANFGHPALDWNALIDAS